MKYLLMVLITLSFSVCSCSSIDRDNPVDKASLCAWNYRLFQGVPAWQLAKTVQDEHEKEIEIKKASRFLKPFLVVPLGLEPRTP